MGLSRWSESQSRNIEGGGGGSRSIPGSLVPGSRSISRSLVLLRWDRVCNFDACGLCCGKIGVLFQLDNPPRLIECVAYLERREECRHGCGFGRDCRLDWFGDPWKAVVILGNSCLCWGITESFFVRNRVFEIVG